MKPLSFRSFAQVALLLLSAVLLASCGGNTDIPLAYSASLTGAEAVPPTPSTAKATGIIAVDPTAMTLRAAVVTSGVADTSATINVAAPGTDGPVVFPLTRNNGDVVWTTTTTITPEQMAALDAGNYYFSVGSTTFPNGELRGQITKKLIDQQARQQLEQLRNQSAAVVAQLRLLWLAQGF